MMKFTTLCALWLATGVAAQTSSSLAELLPHTDPARPGGAVMVVRDGEVLFAQAFGTADIDGDQSNTIASRFYIGSVTKQFTAAAVMHLADAGALRLDDDVREHVPELPDYGDTITIDHLLHHRSGIRDLYELAFLAGQRLGDLDDPAAVLAMICRQQRLNFPPGRDFVYSNSGYLLLAVIVERAAGMSLPAYAERHFFGPLKMARTGYRFEPDAIVDGLVVGHERGERRPLGRFCLVGAGGIYSTVGDLVRWAGELDTGEVLGREFVAALQRVPELQPGQWRSTAMDAYAAGLMRGTHGGLEIVHHAGSFSGYQAECVRFPQQQTTVVCLTNDSGLSAPKIARDLADTVLAMEMATATASAPEVSTAASDARPADGRWMFRDPVSGEICGFSARRGRARYESIAAVLACRAADQRRFTAIDTAVPLSFEVVDVDGTSVLDVRQGEGPPRRYTAMPRTPPAAADLDAICGTWHAAELDAEVTLVRSGGKLRLDTQLMLPVAPFVSASRDVHVSPGRPGLVIEVLRDDDGAPQVLLVSTARARGLRFERR